MLKSNYLFATLLIAVVLLSSAYAQSPSSIDPSRSVNVTIYRDLVRFAAQDADLLRVELFDFTGNKIFDSGFTEGNSLDWFAQDQQGRPVDRSLFAYTLSIKDKHGLVSIAKRGIVSIDRERNNLIEAPALEVIPGNRHKKGILQPQTDGVFDVNATGGASNINAARMELGTAHAGTRLDVGAGSNAPVTPGARLTATSLLRIAGTIKSPMDTISASVINADTQYNYGGYRVLSALGTKNIFVGMDTGLGGYDNSFVGTSAGHANKTGVNNSFFGADAGSFNETGSTNSFFGSSAGFYNKSGNDNSFFGSQAGFTNATGIRNSFFGSGAGQKNEPGSNNSFFGYNAGFANANASNNSFFGQSAGYTNTTGGNNSFFGSQAGYTNTTGGYNSFFGYNAGFANTTGSTNSFFGNRAGQKNETGNNNSFFGGGAGYTNKTSNDNSFFGSNAGFANETGSTNSFFGSNAGYTNTTGGFNSFFGYRAGFANTTGSGNSFFGDRAANANATGSNNSFFGQSAGFTNTFGNGNSFFGQGAGYTNTTGGTNSFFGQNAGYSNMTGVNNAFFGQGAGKKNTTGANSSLLGALADMTDGLTNATAIGFQAFVGQNNSLVLGSIKGVNSATADTNVGIGTTTPAFKLDVAGMAHASSFPTSSDARLKMNVAQLMNVLDKIEKIRGVAFDWNDLYKSLGRSTGHREIGVLAQEVEAVFPELVTHWGEEGYRAVDYGRLTGVLIEAVKELRAEKDSQIAALEEQNAALRDQSAAMDARLTAIEKKLRSSGTHRSINPRRRKISVKRGRNLYHN